MRYSRDFRQRQPQQRRAKRRMLDGIPGASALSVRRLRSDYFGPCIRVRKVGTNVETDIGFAADDFVDVAALLAFAAGGSLDVSACYDQYGHGRHGTQASASQQPRIVTNGFLHTDADRPCMLAPASTTSLAINPVGLFAGVAGASISTVFNLASGGTTAATPFASASTAASLGSTKLGLMVPPSTTIPDKVGVGVRRLDSDPYQFFAGAVNLANISGAPTLSTIVQNYSNARLSQWINRVKNIDGVTAQTPGVTSNTDPFSAALFWRGTAIPAGSSISENIFFHHALSEQERLQIEANQAFAYGSWPI